MAGVLLKDPGVLLKDPGVLLKDPGVLEKDPGVLFKDPGDQAPRLPSRSRLIVLATVRGAVSQIRSWQLEDLQQDPGVL